MKVSEINLDTAQQYLRLTFNDDENELNIYIAAAKSYVIKYTGLTPEEIDNDEYFTIPVLMLIAEFYENKSIHDSKKLNKIFDNLLNLNKVNNL